MNLHANAKEAKRIRRWQAIRDSLVELLICIFVGLLLSSPVIFQMLVDAGILK